MITATVETLPEFTADERKAQGRELKVGDRVLLKGDAGRMSGSILEILYGSAHFVRWHNGRTLLYHSESLILVGV